MRTRFAKALWTRRSEASAQKGSLRILPLLACAVAVIAGMLLLADRARQQADRARQAQVLMERVRNGTERVDLVTWRSLATTSAASPATLAAGLEAYKQVVGSVRELRELGVPRRNVREVEASVGAAYGVGINTLAMSRRDPRAGRRMALTIFRPAMRRLERATTTAAHRQDERAGAALLRARIGGVASLVFGVLLLALLGWRLHRIQGGSALAEQARAAERRGEERLHALVRHSSDVVAVIDPSSRVRWLAESVRGMLNYEPEALVGRRLAELVHPDDAHSLAPFLQDAIAQGGNATMLSVRLRGADGGYRHLELVADNRLSDPLIDGILLNMRDVSERLALLEQLRHQAFHDSLTGLPNRALFEDRLRHALVRLRRSGGFAAVMFVDLDDFKTVNDGLGHAAGDELLRATARRLEDTLRTQDTAARLGGDEFAVLLEDLADEAEALAIAERVRCALEPPLTVAGQQVAPSASIGVACPGPQDGADELLRNADVAMYAAKGRGKAQVALFEDAMRLQAIERLELTVELGAAMAGDELVLDYQPVVALGTGAIAGCEALIRWRHPTRGLLAPARFIGLAESTGLIVGIGAWVIRSACAQLRRWQEEHPAADELEVSVNISARQLADGELPAVVRGALADAGIAPHQLTLEITEGLLVEDGDKIQLQLRELKDIGVRLAVDDFGTGYSALSYLRSFPLDVLKIDRSFVAGIDQDPDRAHLVRDIVEMAHNLGLTVVTEGIEEPGEAALVRDLQSDYGQGYWYSRPVDPATIAELLSGTRAIHALRG
ncbi:MAG TPA: EAL domain-containing protein, partial [Solirubrobacteraceae bacterium]|nr:EAL domain-containing protein [Solirubrobacteraceae bacterium]